MENIMTGSVEPDDFYQFYADMPNIKVDRLIIVGTVEKASCAKQ